MFANVPLFGAGSNPRIQHIRLYNSMFLKPGCTKFSLKSESKTNNKKQSISNSFEESCVFVGVIQRHSQGINDHDHCFKGNGNFSMADNSYSLGPVARNMAR